MRSGVRGKRDWFFPESAGDDWVAVLRLGLGIHVVLYCFALRHEWTYLFAGTGTGLLSRQLSDFLVSAQSPAIPRLGWIVDGAGLLGINEVTALSSAWLLLLIAGVSLTAGMFCRTSAIAAWFLHLCAAKSGGLLSYGLDNFMTIGLFYLMWAPLPDRYALDARWRARSGKKPIGTVLVLRALQLHLCLVYFFGGLAKSLGSGWWDGLNVWRALTRAPFDIIPAETIVRFAPLLPLAGISIWLIEITYPFLIWHRRTRILSLSLICLLHLGIGLAMGMYLFAFIMIVLNVAAFGSLPLPGEQSEASPQTTPPAVA